MNPIPKNPARWILQEKLDGVFCRFTGTAFLSRNGHKFTPPGFWFDEMPSVMIDGELFTQRGDFAGLVSAIQRKRNPWENVTFRPFDMPILRVPVETRLARLNALVLPPHVLPIPSRPCAGQDDLDSAESAVVAAGGEGLILREPGSYYRPGNFVKIKRLFPDLNRSQLD